MRDNFVPFMLFLVVVMGYFIDKQMTKDLAETEIQIRYVPLIYVLEESKIEDPDPWRELNDSLRSNIIHDMSEVELDNFLCLATNIYHEARGSTQEDMVATAHVVMNRVNDGRWPDTICETIWQEKQFSWTSDVNAHFPKNRASWEHVQDIALRVMRNEIPDPTPEANHYHHVDVSPAWSYVSRNHIRIGDHKYINIE